MLRTNNFRTLVATTIYYFSLTELQDHVQFVLSSNDISDLARASWALLLNASYTR